MKKYQYIAKELKNKIQQNIYPEGSHLPSEHELTNLYQVSRDTIRKALAQLEKEKLIEKSQGKASKVRFQQSFNFPVSNLTSYQELVQELHLNSQTKVISISRLIVDESLSEITGFLPKQQVWQIKRLRLVDGIAAVLDIDYLLTDIVKKMTAEIASASLYDYLEHHLNLSITFAEKVITIPEANDEDRLRLDIGTDHHVVSVQSRVYLSDHTHFQSTESRHILDKFRFVDFATRHK